MKRGEVLVHKDNYKLTKFHCIQMKRKKVFLMAHFTNVILKPC